MEYEGSYIPKRKRKLKKTAFHRRFIVGYFWDLSELAYGEPETLSKIRDRDPADIFEEKAWRAFENLGFEVLRWGHEKRWERFADGALLSDREYAVMFDSKIAKDGYRIGTEDRKIVEHIREGIDYIEWNYGIKEFYYMILSSRFKGDFSSSIQKIRRESGITVKSVTLLEADLLIYLLEVKFHNPKLSPKVLKYIFRDDGLITKKRIDKVLKERVHHITDFSYLMSEFKRGGIIIGKIRCPKCNFEMSPPESGSDVKCAFCGEEILAIDVFKRIYNQIKLP